MTDTLPPPPAEIVVDLKPGEAEYLAQGGRDYNFWYKSTEFGDAYIKTDVSTHEYIRSHYYKNIQRVSAFENTLLEAMSQGEISPDLAGEFAAIFGFTLNREYHYTVNVTYTIHAELPFDYDPDQLVETLNFSADSQYGDDVEINFVDADVTNASWDEYS